MRANNHHQGTGWREGTQKRNRFRGILALSLAVGSSPPWRAARAREAAYTCRREGRARRTAPGGEVQGKNGAGLERHPAGGRRRARQQGDDQVRGSVPAGTGGHFAGNAAYQVAAGRVDANQLRR